nr:MAG TPA: hypothetical protein [Caudoviricetes sp.]
MICNKLQAHKIRTNCAQIAHELYFFGKKAEKYANGRISAGMYDFCAGIIY